MIMFANESLQTHLYVLLKINLYFKYDKKLCTILLYIFRSKREIRHLEAEVQKWQILVDTVSLFENVSGYFKLKEVIYLTSGSDFGQTYYPFVPFPFQCHNLMYKRL